MASSNLPNPGRRSFFELRAASGPPVEQPRARSCGRPETCPFRTNGSKVEETGRRRPVRVVRRADLVRPPRLRSSPHPSSRAGSEGADWAVDDDCQASSGSAVRSRIEGTNALPGRAAQGGSNRRRHGCVPAVQIVRFSPLRTSSSFHDRRVRRCRERRRAAATASGTALRAERWTGLVSRGKIDSA